MAQPAGALLSAMYPIALGYTRATLSVIPAEEKRKDPSFLLNRTDEHGTKTYEWGQYQRAIATPEKMLSWWTAMPRANVAIVCGEVSKNLVVLDIDDLDFCRWLEQTVTETILKKTWTVRTGSGKLHVYVRTTTEMGSTVVSDRNGKHLLDLRAKGWYVLAPPSVHPTGGVYTTLYGGSDRIAGISDLAGLLTRLVDAYNARTPHQQAPQNPLGGTRKQPLVPVGRMGVEEAERLIKRLNAGGMAKRMTKALSEGAKAGHGDWASTVSNSEIDFIVMKEMTRNGISRAEVQRAYDYFPLGLNCYRNTSRPNHGLSYLQATLDNVDKALAAATQAMLHTAGDNFRVMSSIRLLSEPPVFYTVLRNYDTQEDERIRMDFNDWASEHAFKQSVFRQVPRLVPQLGGSGGQHFVKFVSLVALMCDLEDVPPEAKMFGVTRAQVLHILKERLSDFTPTSHDQISLGWIDRQRDYAAFRSRVLMSLLSMQNKQTPEMGRVWEIVRGWGGIEKAIPLSGLRETFWLVQPSRLGL